VQNTTSGPAALGGGGGCLGYCGLTPSAAVEFNLYSGQGGSGTRYAVNGATTGYTSTLPLDLGSGNPILITLKYDGTILTETLLDLNTGQRFTGSYSANIPVVLGGTNSAWVGFTGATGGLASYQTVTAFSFARNVPPSIVLSSPTNGAVFSAPANITLVANPSDIDGVVRKVEFFQSAVKLGEATATPWQFTWNQVAAGAYTLSALATDDMGATNASSSIQINVAAPSLGVAVQGNQIVVSWATSPVSYVLEATDSLTQPTVWNPTTDVPVVGPQQTTVTISPGPGSRFYRLRTP